MALGYHATCTPRRGPSRAEVEFACDRFGNYANESAMRCKYIMSTYEREREGGREGGRESDI